MNPGRSPFAQTGRGIPAPFMQANISTGEKLVKLKSGEIVKQKTTTTTTPGTEGTPGTPGTAPVTIKGKAPVAATPATKGNRGGPEFDKAYGAAVKSGKGSFEFGGKSFNTAKSLPTKAKPGKPGTPDITLPGKEATPATPATPPSISSETSTEKIPSKVYGFTSSHGFSPGMGNENVRESRGTVTTDPARLEAAKKFATDYNTDLDKRYAAKPDYTGTDPIRKAAREKQNATLAARRTNLRKTVTTNEIDTNLGLENKTARSERKDKLTNIYAENAASRAENSYDPAAKQLRKPIAKKKSPAKMKVSKKTAYDIKEASNQKLKPGARKHYAENAQAAMKNKKTPAKMKKC